MNKFRVKSKILMGIPIVCIFFSGFSFLPTPYFLLVNIGIIMGVFCQIHRINFLSQEFGLGILWVLFFYFYYRFYKAPDLPDGWVGGIDLEAFLRNSTNLLSVFLIIALERSSSRKVKVLSCLPMGMLAFASLNTIFTLIKLEPPYYGRTYSFMLDIVYNSPGTTILGSMLSIYLIAFKKGFQNISKIFWILLVLALGFGSWISVLFTARTFFLVLILAILLLIAINGVQTFKLGLDKYLLFLAFFSFGSLLIFYMNGDFLIRTMERLKTGDYSEKLLHHKDYFAQVRNSFWQYPRSTFTYPWHFWFHSFLPDVHRTSGPYTLLVAALIVIGTYVKSFWNSYQKTELGRESSIFLILFIPYLLTTIPWESSESQMLVLFAGVSAIVISDRKKVSHSV